MSTMHTRLVGTEQVAHGTAAFHFERPDGFDFKAGQAIDLVLNGTDDMRHAFSLVGAPSERELTIATRLRDSAYKRALRDLPLGAQVGIDGPFGSLVLHKNLTRPAVFIAGGIGITPFISMLRQARSERAGRRLLLLYSNRRPEDAAFLGELQQMALQDPHFRMIATMTQMADSPHPWSGATGKLDADAVRNAVRGLDAPIYYLAGPPAMVAGMRDALARAEVDDESIRSEEFFGY